MHLIGSDDATFKLCRIENKNAVKGGNTQLNLHDGSNVAITVDNPQNAEEDIYHTLDVLKLNVIEREIIDYTELTVGSPALVIGGKNMGQVGKIVSIEQKENKKRRDLLVTLKHVNGTQFQTILDFVFILGKTEPLVSMPEAT